MIQLTDKIISQRFSVSFNYHCTGIVICIDDIHVYVVAKSHTQNLAKGSVHCNGTKGLR